MEDGAVIERDAVLLGVGDGTGPVFGAVGEADEILDSDGSDFRKQGAMEVAGRGVNDGGGVGGSGSAGLWTGGMVGEAEAACAAPSREVETIRTSV